MENYASTPENQFKVHRQDIVDALEGEENLTEVIFWHSHPSGGVGPSRTDYQEKTPFNYHLVLTLVDNEVLQTWY